MFPQIAKKKKRDLAVEELVYKEWEEVCRELDNRCKLIVKKLPNGLLHDFSKVCRIKSIPQFYANYFLSYIYRHGEQQLAHIFSQEIQNILTHRSHFHRVSEVLKQREEIISNTKDSLLVVEGLLLMSQGKNVPLVSKGIIEQLAKECLSLEELKEFQKKRTEQLVRNIFKVRQNTIKLIKQVGEWRHYLEQLGKGDGTVLKKNKIIYPSQAFNCLLLPFYDTLFLKNSSLKSQFTFSRDHDPFFEKMTKSKRSSPIQTYFYDLYKTDINDYGKNLSQLLEEFPKDEAEELRQKQLEKQRELKAKEEKKKQEKLRDEKVKEQKLREIRTQREKDKKVRVERYSSLKKLKGKTSDELQRKENYRSSRGERSEKKIINIDVLLQGKVSSSKELPKKDQLKIIGVYKKGKSSLAMKESLILSDREDEIHQQKKNWEKQMKQQKLQKQKIKKLLKQTEKKALVETRIFEQKLKRYEEEVANLKSKVDSSKKGRRSIMSSEKPRSPIKQKKAGVSPYGSVVREPGQGSVVLLSSKLEEESRIRRNLEQQIKSLAGEKDKLQKLIDKQSSKLSKESEVYRMKIGKYEEVIDKLKQESEQNRKLIKDLETSKISEEKKISQNLRMYTIKQKEQQLKRKIQQKMEMRQQRKRLKQSKLEEEAKKRKERSINKSSIKIQKLDSSRENIDKDLQIVKTKQTIEIVFESRANKRKKQPISKESIEAESRLIRLEKERQLLQRKLEMSQVGKEGHKKLLESKIQEKEKRVDYFKQKADKEREKNMKLQQNLRQMRKSINNEYELKINKERIRFQREREDLIKAIEKQRQQKHAKDKFLDQQMKLLKQMEKNENELINLLEKEKKDKQAKQRILAEQLQKKQQLRNMIQIEEIKRSIERQVRRELLQSESSDQESGARIDIKSKIEQQIQHLREERDHQISEIDEQNQKLRELIARIKGEENKLLEVIKENIQLESEEQYQISNKSTIFNEQKQHNQIITSPQISTIANNKQLVQQLQSKTLNQFKNEQKKKNDFMVIGQSQLFKERQKIQNLVQFYLKSPHKYPGEEDIVLKKQQKRQMVRDIQQNTRRIQQFHHQLLNVKDMPDFVPSLKNDSINNHLLNLRQAYNDYEADALRRELFPPLKEGQVYNERELSVQSEQPPMETLMDEVNVHTKKYSPKKNEDKKNFLAINRVRLMLLEQNKKKKEREIIEEQSKRKIQKLKFDKNRKKREEHARKQFEREEHEKERMRIQLQKKTKNKDIVGKERRRKHESEKSQQSELQYKKNRKKGNNSDSQQSSSGSSKKIVLGRSRKRQSERGLSESENERSKKTDSQTEMKYSSSRRQSEIRQKSEGQKQQKEVFGVIKEQGVQQSLDQKEEAQMEKAERQLLKSQIKSLQSEIREYISKEQQFSVYQQFINEEDTASFIAKLIELSSPQIVHLNGNSSLEKDIDLYCTVTVLVAKDSHGIQVGMGIFHKEYESQQYICDYILAHKMEHFLDLIFNFSKYVYACDPFALKIEYLFDLKFVEDEETLGHFLQFQRKCRRLGEVYVKAKNTKERKYILKRTLFEQVQKSVVDENKGIEIDLKLLLYSQLLREINAGFNNIDNIHYSSLYLILAYFLSKNPQLLIKFRQKTENQLTYRQVLITALLFQKKELQIKSFKIQSLQSKEKENQIQQIKQKFDVNKVDQIEQTRVVLRQKLPKFSKRCVLQVGIQQIRYLVYKPQEALTRIQSSNSSQTGYFLSLMPKYKVLIIQAQQFLSMSNNNSDLTAFFYIKHFIKNIVEVKKEVYQRVYLPEIVQQSYLHLDELSKKVNGTMFLGQKLKIGWDQAFGNSIIFTPKHRDLVIQKPFIVAVLSGSVERAVEGSPICLRLIK